MGRPVVVGTFGVVLAVVLTLGTVDTFVWLPQYLAPGIPLDRIYDALAASDDLPYTTTYAVAWLLFWTVLAAAYVALLLPASPRFRPAIAPVRPIAAAALGALLLGATGFLHWWSAFGMGMSVSDELPPYGGGTTPLGVVIVLGGVLSGVTGLVIAVVALAAQPKVVRASA